MKRTAVTRRARRSGFTLLEILIVVGIIALLAAFVVPNLMNTQRGAQVKMAQSAVDSNGPIATALKMYNLHMGTYPKELKQLVDKPDGDDAKKWQGPYIEDATKLKDPWGEDYQYRFPSSSQGEDKYDLWSKGPNKQDGDEDDIVNWTKA
jgi:general secretion pathway protein G